MLENNKKAVKTVRKDVKLKQKKRLEEESMNGALVDPLSKIESEIEIDWQAQKAKERDNLLVLRTNALVASAKLDKHDIQHETYDAMSASLGWRILEYWPSVQRILTEKGFVNHQM